MSAEDSLKRDLKNMTRKQLEKLRAEIDAALEKLKKADLKAARQAAEKAARAHGFSLAEIAGGAIPAPAAPKKARKSPGKVAPKYRNPADGATWTGRGRQPVWFREAMAAGKKPEDFLI